MLFLAFLPLKAHTQERTCSKIIYYRAQSFLLKLRYYVTEDICILSFVSNRGEKSFAVPEEEPQASKTKWEGEVWSKGPHPPWPCPGAGEKVFAGQAPVGAVAHHHSFSW